MSKKKPNFLAAKRAEGIGSLASMFAKLNYSKSEIEAALLAEAKKCEGATATIAPWVMDRIYNLLTTFRDMMRILGMTLKYSIPPPRRGKYQNKERDIRAKELRGNGKSYGEIGRALIKENPDWGDDGKPLSPGAVYRLLQRLDVRKGEWQKKCRNELKSRQVGNEPTFSALALDPGSDHALYPCWFLPGAARSLADENWSKAEQHIRAKLGIPATAPVDWSQASFTAKEGATAIPIDWATIIPMYENLLIASMYAESNYSRPEVEAFLLAEAKNREGATATIAPWVVDSVYSLLTAWREELRILGMCLQNLIPPPRRGKYKNEERDAKANELQASGMSYSRIAQALFDTNKAWGDKEKPYSVDTVRRMIQRWKDRKQRWKGRNKETPQTD